MLQVHFFFLSFLMISCSCVNVLSDFLITLDIYVDDSRKKEYIDQSPTHSQPLFQSLIARGKADHSVRVPLPTGAPAHNLFALPSPKGSRASHELIIVYT